MDPVRIHNDMCARAFGRQHMPPCVKEAITGMRQRGIEETRERFKQAAQEIAEIQVLTRPKEEIFRESQPTHVRETQRHLNHEFYVIYIKSALNIADCLTRPERMPEIEEFLTVSDEQQVKNVLDQIEQKIRHQLEFT